MSREFAISTKPYLDFKLYNRKNFTIQSGLTVLTWSGENNFAKAHRNRIKRKQYPCLLF